MANLNFIKTICFSGIILCAIAGYSQSDLSCTAKAPSEVGVGQQFQYTVSTNEKGEIISSDFGKFELVSGPSVGSSVSISMTNGNIEKSTSYTYTYYLVGNKEGEFSIPGVTISVEGKIIKTDFVTVKVVKVPKIAQQQESGRGQDNWFHWDFSMPEWPFGNQPSQSDNNDKQKKVQVDDKIGKDDILLKATASQLEAYQGEAVVVTHKLYIKPEISGYSIERAAFSTAEGLWIDALELSGRAQQTTETVNGKEYNVFVIKQTAVYPTRTGKLTIPKLNLTMYAMLPATAQDPFWGMFNTTRRKEVSLSSNELQLKVKAMPGTLTTDKTEIVGNFTVSSSVSKTETGVSSPLTLTVTVSGTGNLHHITADDLAIDFPADFDVTRPRVTEHISAKSDQVTGSKTFKYTLIPRSEGTYLIPAATLSYFNYDMGTYRTLSTQDYQITVTPGSNAHENGTDDTPQKSKSNVKTYKI